jgi:hypothetical protein
MKKEVKISKMNKPIRIKVSERTQAGDIFIYKEGMGMCQSGIVHLEQKGFTEKMCISFEVAKIPKIIEALKKLPTLTEKNQDEFLQEITPSHCLKAGVFKKQDD